MYFAHELKDIAYQYSFVKSPDFFIEHLSILQELQDIGEEDSIEYVDNFPSSSDLQIDFKNTNVYRALKFNKDDSQKVASLKQAYTNAYLDVLSAMGLAIQARIIQGLEQIYKETDSKAADERVSHYFHGKEYMDDLKGIISFPEHPIDIVSFYIANRELDEEGLKVLEKMKNYYLEPVQSIKNSLFDFASINFVGGGEKYNYKKINDWIIPIYMASVKATGQGYINDYLVDIFDKEDEDENAKNKKENDNTQKTTSENIKKSPPAPKVVEKPTQSQRKIIPIEEALDKNFAGLVGLKDVKKAILRKTKLIEKLPTKLVDCNFRLTGNPGVGKTTVAEVMSKSFYDAGIIKNNTFVQMNGAGLKGKYVGHTVGKVQEIFESAKGGTLFLDEVYSLISNEGSDDSFAQEAITELMIQLESLYAEQKKNPDSRTLVIMAGYKDKLDALLSRNIGFARRFPNAINIKDYSVEELLEIFNLYVKNDGLTVEKSALEKVAAILKTESKKKNFSNAGYVRNLVQAVEESQAVRSSRGDFKIIAEDVEDAEQNLNEDITPKDRPVIGF